MKLAWVFLFGTAVLFFSCGNSERLARFQALQIKKIAVIPMGANHSYWKSCKEGALKAGKELDLEILWQGPQKEDDAALQAQVMNSFIQEGVDAIIIAPIDGKSLLSSVSLAQTKGIPVVVIDSKLEEAQTQSFVGTNNEKAGEKCADEMLSRLGGKGKVFIFQLQRKVVSTRERETGFRNRIKREPEIEILEENIFAGPSQEAAKNSALFLLRKHPDLSGVFTVNESSSLAMDKALKELGLHQKIAMVGFDSHPKVVQALKSGEVEALAVQNPFEMGYLGVKNAFAALEHNSYSKNVDTEVVLLTKENIDQFLKKTRKN
jgi:ribose transport system substrate-binding protein